MNRKAGNTDILLIPFHSYLNIFEGDWEGILENLGNIVLFIPFSIVLSIITGDRRKSFTICFCLSVCIELVQLISLLGIFEIDDIIHNSFGAWIGTKFFLKREITNRNKVKIVCNGIFLAICILMFGVLTREFKASIENKRIVEYAALNNDGDSPNLLLIDPQIGRIGDSNVKMIFSKDGRISIIGNSNTREIKKIAEQEFEPGIYEFRWTGFAKENNAYIQIEYWDESKKCYLPVIDSITCMKETIFTLTKKEHVCIYIGVYPNSEINMDTRMAIYKK